MTHLILQIPTQKHDYVAITLTYYDMENLRILEIILYCRQQSVIGYIFKEFNFI